MNRSVLPAMMQTKTNVEEQPRKEFGWQLWVYAHHIFQIRHQTLTRSDKVDL